jgi:hypothetical protein
VAKNAQGKVGKGLQAVKVSFPVDEEEVRLLLMMKMR